MAISPKPFLKLVTEDVVVSISNSSSPFRSYTEAVNLVINACFARGHCIESLLHIFPFLVAILVTSVHFEHSHGDIKCRDVE